MFLQLEFQAKIFDPKDKPLNGFRALRWVIEKSKVFRRKEEFFEDPKANISCRCHCVFSQFRGVIPHKMASDLFDLVKKGYRTKEDETNLLVKWFSHKGKKEHTVTVHFGTYRLNEIWVYYRTSFYEQPIEHILK